MKALVIGGPGSIMDAVLDKLNKEGNRIYVLTGTTIKLHSYRHVFEQYSFSYDSSGIRGIFESIRPDVTIFMGAYDSNFKWENSQEDAMYYQAALMNVLMGYSLVKSGKFIYLSSESVYGRYASNALAEETPVTASDFKGMVIAQGEEQCMSFMRFDNVDILILRLDNMYGIPKDSSDVYGICARMCIQAVSKGEIEVNGNHSFSMLHVSDAVAWIYDIIKAPVHERTIYHLSSGQTVSETELAQMVIKELDGGVSVKDNTIGEKYQIALDGDRFKEEFNAKVFWPAEKAVPAMVSQIKKHKNKYLYKEDKGQGLVGRLLQSGREILAALIPFIENIIIFIPVYMLNDWASGSSYFSRMDFFLLYVILFALLYGQQQATFSGILATFGYIISQLDERSGFETLVDFSTYVWIAQIFILGLVIGYFHDQLAYVKKEKNDQVAYLKAQIKDIEEINSSNVRMKNVMEEQLINHNQSLGKIYEITSALDTHGPEETIFYAAETVERLLGTSDVAVYVVSNERYARLQSFTSKKAQVFGNSICYTDMTDMYSQIKEKEVYINNTLKEGYPLMARGIYSEDALHMIIMVWGLSLEHMNLGTANMFTIVCSMIENAMLRTDKIRQKLGHEIYISDTGILRKEDFKSVINAYRKASERNLTTYSLLSVKTMPGQTEQTGVVVGKIVRGTDYIGEIDGEIWILLSNTDAENAQNVIERLGSAGCKAVCREVLEIQ